MQLELAMLALGADHSSSGLLHIFGGGLDSITFDKLPAVLPPFFLVVQLTQENVVEAEEHTLTVAGINPDGDLTKLTPQGTSFQFKATQPPGGVSRATVMLQIYLTAKLPGRHQFVVSADGAEIKRLPITITVP